jgi:hypothetical protein
MSYVIHIERQGRDLGFMTEGDSDEAWRFETYDEAEAVAVRLRGASDRLGVDEFYTVEEVAE